MMVTYDSTDTRSTMTDDDTMTTVPWYITFGVGGLHGGTYTEVRVPASLPREEQEQRARLAAFEAYSTAWAFCYPPEKFVSCIGRYGMTLREVIRP